MDFLLNGRSMRKLTPGICEGMADCFQHSKKYPREPMNESVMHQRWEITGQRMKSSKQ
jgi:hypothetical protein